MLNPNKPRLNQSCVVPYRLRDGVPEICLVTSIGKKRWGLPKGIVEPGETSEEAALKEAREEAGLAGELVGPPLGEYDDYKWDTDLRVTGYLMLVTEASEIWLEVGLRQRAWVSPEEAKRRLARKEQRVLLDVAMRRLKEA